MEDIEINLTDYNKMIEDFVEEVQMSINSKLCVIFEVNLTAYANGEMITENYQNEMQITIGEKITKITGKFNDSKENEKTRKVEVKKETNKFTNIAWMVITCLGIIGIIIVKMETKPTNKISNTFKSELNQILNICGDKIVKISSNNTMYGNSIIELSDINELVKLSEETFKPILYYQVPNKNIAWFYVVLEKEIYRYILK